MNKYNAAEFEQQAQSLKYDLAVKQIFGYDTELTYEYAFCVTHTIREFALKKQFSMIPLWYLQMLADADPVNIVDIGCGSNHFKPVIEKIYRIPCHGIDPTPNNTAADEFDTFDTDFSQGHTNAYSSVFSICALHFVPLSYMTTRIKEFYNVVAPGGRGFLALNSARMVERTSAEWLLNTLGTADPTPAQIQAYVQEQVSTLDMDFMAVDLLITEQPNECMDGNIRMVFKKMSSSKD